MLFRSIPPFAVLACLGFLAACSADSTSRSECDPGTSVSCVCGEEPGLQVCSPDGVQSACLCGDDLPADVSFDVPDPPDTGDASGFDVSIDVVENEVRECDEILLWPDLDGDGHGDVNAEPLSSCEYLLGYVSTSTDCDDSDRNIFPSAPELCDEIDNDCDEVIDEEAESVRQWIDADDDGYGDPDSEPMFACALEAGYATNDDDCDDADGDTNPAVADLCDGLDNDCDDEVDEDATLTVYFADVDGDGFGDDQGIPQNFCTPPEGMVDNRLDCDDEDIDVNPDIDEICNLIDDDCDGRFDEGVGLMLLWPDADTDDFGDATASPEYACEMRDGYVTNGGDCDDTLFTINPDSAESCNLVDDDCNGLIDDGAIDLNTYYPDADGDGFGVSSGPVRACVLPANFAAAGGDCDDRFAAIRPGVDELCDGVDNDCDRIIDEGVTNACGGCGTTPAEQCGNFLDDDCDGTIDEAADGCFCDGRTNQPCYGASPATLGVGLCRGGVADCACPGGARFCTDGAWGACVGQVLPAEEICDGEDNDCDGRVDEGLRNACGVCGAAEPVEICDGEDNDCDGSVDEYATLTCGSCTAGTVAETCGNGLDDDCDGSVDESCGCSAATEACYPGAPSTRGVGLCTDGLRDCYAGAEGPTACVGAVVPAVEICDGEDNDCDGRVDEAGNGCSICGATAEICDDVDNDCDGFVDEQLRNGCGDCFEDVSPEETAGLSLCDGDDNDCDGFIDEGLINACGNCDEACYVDGWDDDDEFENGGDGDGIIADNGLRLSTTSFNFNDLWIANTADDTVTRINTTTGAVVGTYPVGVNSGRNNDNPSRTAVDLDGNAWVANRANSSSGLQGSITKVRGGDCVTDCVLFNHNIGGPGGVPRALAVDANNDVWVGLYGERRMYHLNGEDGALIATYDIGLPTYGFAIDREGIIWIATQSGSHGIGAFDTNTNTLIGNWLAPSCANTYGLAVDSVGNVWAGTWSCNTMIRVDRARFDADPREVSFQTIAPPNFTSNRGVAVDGNGFIWMVSSGGDRLGQFNSAGTLLRTGATCDQPVGVGVAATGNIWIACLGSDQAQEWYAPPSLAEPLRLERTVAVGDNPYSYSDMTGFQLRAFTAPAGDWVQTFDCGFEGCGIEQVRWNAVVPAGTTLSVRARTRPSSGSWSDWSADFTSSPANTSALPWGRYVEVRIRMTTTEDELTPVVSSVDVDWQRP